MILYEQACNGQPQVVLLEGEAGIGKTHLAAVFLDLAKAHGANVLEGRSFKTTQRLPYQLLLDSLHTRLKEEHELRQLMGDSWLAELTRLLPELRYRYPDLPPPTINGAFASSRLFEALARLSRALASPHFCRQHAVDGLRNPGRVPVSCSILDRAGDARHVTAEQAHRNA